MRHLTLTFAALLVLAASPAFAKTERTQADAPAAPVTTELPRNARPTHYDIAVTPHAADMKFDGKVTITLELLQPGRHITLNAAGMTIHAVSLTAANGKAEPTPKVKVDEAAETVTLDFRLLVKPGRYKLAIGYTGTILTQADGLFAIDYVTAQGDKRALFTQFEEAGARKFIPSWDEPDYKATFTLTATIPAGQLAVSNMPVARRKPVGNGLERITFQTTPKMSTYLLFFSLGDLERATTKLGKTTLGVVAQRGMVGQAAFALASAKQVLADYDRYFGIPYPLPKLDNVAAPGRGYFGAMENWGAIFTFENILLLDPAISTEADRQSVFSALAHETAHMWFGDLVTMKWWDDIWLNEGFASWMSSRTQETLHPEWQTALRAVASRERAMGQDAFATTHPVVQHIANVKQARLAFDAITYSKGRAVIDMLEDYVGPAKWRAGVHNYLAAHAYGNATSDDLWRAIQAASSQPVLGIAHDFTLQPGIPLIRVGRASCHDGKTTVALTQGEFSPDRRNKKPLAWRVPVIVQILGGKSARTVVSGGEATLTVVGCGALIVNAGQKGYYRTVYDPAEFAALRDHFARLAPIDQLGVLADSWALGMAGYQPAADFMDLVAATPADAVPRLWYEIADKLVALDEYYGHDVARRDAFRQFATSVLGPELARIGWQARPGETDPVKILRMKLIDALGRLADPDVVAEARRRFAASDVNPIAMPPALRKTVLQVVARNADDASWEKLHTMAKTEKSSLVRDQLYMLLAMARDPALANRALALALGDEPGVTLTGSLLRTVADGHPDAAFDFAVAHRAKVDGRMDPNDVSRFYGRLASQSLDPAMPDKLEAFAQTHIAEGSRGDAEAAIAKVRYRIQVRQERLPEIDTWLTRRGN